LKKRNNSFAFLDSEVYNFLSKNYRQVKRIIRFTGVGALHTLLKLSLNKLKVLLNCDIKERREFVKLSRTLGIPSNVLDGFQGHLRSIPVKSINKAQKKVSGKYNVLLKRGDRYVLESTRSKIFAFKNNFGNLFLTKWKFNKNDFKLTKFSYPLFKLNKMYRLFIANFSVKQFGLNCLKKILRMIEDKNYNNLYLFLKSLKMRSSSRKKADVKSFIRVYKPTTNVVDVKSTTLNKQFVEVIEEDEALEDFEKEEYNSADENLEETLSVHSDDDFSY